MKTNGLPRNLRLIRTEDFGVLLKASRKDTIYVSNSCFSVHALIVKNDIRLRMGVTVGKKNAPRSVDRALVKRILREAFRKKASILMNDLQTLGLGLDVSLRLRIPLKQLSAHSQGVTAMKAVLGDEANDVVKKLHRHIAKMKSSDLRCPKRNV